MTWSDLKAVILRSDRHGSTHERDQVPTGDAKPLVQPLTRLEESVINESDRHGSTHERDLVRPEGLSPSSLTATEVLMTVTWSDR